MDAEDNCLGCDARCCGKYLVAVIPSDIARIARRTGKRPAEFLQLFPSSECNCRWAPSFWVKGEECYVGLKRKKDGCVFLRKGRCTIHSFKPLVCSTFPFCIDEENVAVSNACIRKGRWKPGAKDCGSLSRYHSELQRMRRLAVEWDWRRKGEGSAKELLAFLSGRERQARSVSKKFLSFRNLS